MSASIRAYSSAYKGFPPERSTTAERISGESESRPSDSSRSRPVSTSDKADSGTTAHLPFAAAKLVLRLSRSGRVVATNRRGTDSVQWIR